MFTACSTFWRAPWCQHSLWSVSNQHFETHQQSPDSLRASRFILIKPVCPSKLLPAWDFNIWLSKGPRLRWTRWSFSWVINFLLPPVCLCIRALKHWEVLMDSGQVVCVYACVCVCVSGCVCFMSIREFPKSHFRQVLCGITGLLEAAKR